MKIQTFTFIVALFIGMLIFYAFRQFGTLVPSLIGSVVCTLFLVASMGIVVQDAPRSTTMFRTLATLLFFLLLIINGLFLRFNAAENTFILINGIITLTGITGLYLICRSKQ